MTTSAQRSRVAADVVRQLASAFASYRLFPDEPDQPGFRAAVGRVRYASEIALATGSFHVEVRQGRFQTADGPIDGDETIDRFALACFDRGIEHLHLRAVPEADDLVALGDLLVAPIEDVAADGPRAALAGRGVSAIVVGEVAPEGSHGPGIELWQLGAEELALWEGLSTPGALARRLQAETALDDPTATADELYRRFRSLHEKVPSDVAARHGLLLGARKVLSGFPPEVRRAFARAVFEGVHHEGFAADIAVDLTDAELAEMLTDLGAHGGDDPVAVAEQVVTATGRPREVIDLIAVKAGRPLPSGGGAADPPPTLLALRRESRDTELDRAVAEALAEELSEVATEDAAYLRDMFPRTEADHRTLSLLALRDYLMVDERRVSTDRVLQRWTDAVRRAVVAGDVDQVDRLLVVTSDLSAADDVFKRDAGVRALASVPDMATVRALVVAGLGSDDSIHDTADRLRGFGAGALDSVLDLLAIEEDRSVRAQLVAFASELGGQDIGRITKRADDPRWYVVRNLATILGRRGDRGGVPVLVQMLDHGEASVRREALRSLVSCARADAVPHLRRLAEDPDQGVRTAAITALGGIRTDAAARALAGIARTGGHHDDGRRAIDALAQHPAPVAHGLLAELASRRQKPRPPRALRKHAKLLARRSGKRST